MGKKKDFWELADSTILGRTKKAQLLQIARAEHKQVESYRTQFNLQAEQLRDREVLVAQLNDQIKKLGTVAPEVLRGLVGKFDEQQRNHEQELSKLQSAAKNWEKLSQNYKDVIGGNAEFGQNSTLRLKAAS
jgi:hypothetical protein